MSRPRSVSDEQILQTVRRCALEQGANFSLDDVADRLGVSSPALLKRFGTRDRLVFAALKPPSPDFLSALEQGPTHAPLRAQLKEILASFTGFFSQVFPCMMVLRESNISWQKMSSLHDDAPTVAARKAIHGWLSRARKAGIVKADEVETAASAMIGAVIARIALDHISKIPLRSVEQSAFVEELASLFSRSLATSDPEHKPGRRKKKEPIQ
jgi:AcrR family transcriptional regulator